MKLWTSISRAAALSLVLCAAFALAPAACTNAGGGAAGAAGAYPGTREGAEKLLKALMKPGGDLELTKALQPKSEDYAAVFEGEVAKKEEDGYKELWAKIEPIAAKDGQTELLLFSATSEELKSGADAAKEFPGGYAKVGPHLKPGFTWYRFKFVKPNKTSNMAFDGLVHVNGHWALFPKPWRNLGEG